MTTLGRVAAIVMWAAAALFAFVGASAFYEVFGRDAFIITGPKAELVHAVLMSGFAVTIGGLGYVTWEAANVHVR